MDEARLRAIMREEIALAVQTLGRVAGDAAGSMSDDLAGERDGAYALESAAGVFFQSAYEADTAVADERRAEGAANPFAEPGGDPVPAWARAFVHAEIQNVLREMRDSLYESGLASDYSVAERLDRRTTAREREAVACDHTYAWRGTDPDTVEPFCSKCGASRPEPE